MNSTAGFSAGIGAFPPFAITPNFEDADSLQHHGLRDVTSLEDLARLGGGFTWPTTAPMSSAPVESRRVMPPDPPEAKVGAVSAATAGAQQPYDASPCWGFVLTNGRQKCSPGFNSKPGRFRNKFCPNCLGLGISIEAERLRLLPEDCADDYANPSSRGCYAEKDGNLYRVVNHTRKSIKGEAIIVARDAAAAAALGMEEVPQEYFLNPGRLELSVSQGTLVPTKFVTTRRDAFAGFQFEPEMVAVKPESASAVKQEIDYDYPMPPSPALLKRSRSESETSDDTTEQDMSFVQGGQGGTSSLLELARSHAQLGSQLQQALDQTSDETDPHIVEYHKALRRLIDPLAKATEALFQTKRPKPCTQELQGPALWSV